MRHVVSLHTKASQTSDVHSTMPIPVTSCFILVTNTGCYTYPQSLGGTLELQTLHEGLTKCSFTIFYFGRFEKQLWFLRTVQALNGICTTFT